MRLYDQLRSRWDGVKSEASGAGISRAEAAATRQLPQFMSATPGSVEGGVGGFVSSIPAVAATPSAAMQDNIVGFTQVVVLATLLAQAETITQTTFRTSEEAISTGDALAALLAEQAIVAVESGQRELGARFAISGLLSSMTRVSAVRNYLRRACCHRRQPLPLA
jgi:hypothetical protein